MTPEQYAAATAAHLRTHTDAVVARVREAIAHLVPGTEGLTFQFFFDDEVDLFLTTVMLSCIGPDVYVRDKAIEPWRTLYDEGFTAFDAITGGADIDDVDEVLLGDAVIAWAQEVWTQVKTPSLIAEATIIVGVPDRTELLD